MNCSSVCFAFFLGGVVEVLGPADARAPSWLFRSAARAYFGVRLSTHYCYVYYYRYCC